MNKDIREAHMEFAKELLKMYDDVNEFENIKERYLNIAKGNIPNDIETIKINENEISIIDLIITSGFSKSKGEAKRMIQGKGIKLNGDLIEDINKVITLDKEVVLQFGKNKFKKIVR